MSSLPVLSRGGAELWRATTKHVCEHVVKPFSWESNLFGTKKSSKVKGNPQMSQEFLAKVNVDTLTDLNISAYVAF